MMPSESRETDTPANPAATEVLALTSDGGSRLTFYSDRSVQCRNRRTGKKFDFQDIVSVDVLKKPNPARVFIAPGMVATGLLAIFYSEIWRAHSAKIELPTISGLCLIILGALLFRGVPKNFWSVRVSNRSGESKLLLGSASEEGIWQDARQIKLALFGDHESNQVVPD